MFTLKMINNQNQTCILDADYYLSVYNVQLKMDSSAD